MIEILHYRDPVLHGISLFIPSSNIFLDIALNQMWSVLHQRILALQKLMPGWSEASSSRISLSCLER